MSIDVSRIAEHSQMRLDGNKIIMMLDGHDYPVIRDRTDGDYCFVLEVTDGVPKPVARFTVGSDGLFEVDPV